MRLAIAALLLLATPVAAEQPRADARAVAAVVAASKINLVGDVLTSKGDKVFFRSEIRAFRSTESKTHLWRWASVTKQVIATLVMQQVAAGRIDLDAPLSTYLPGFTSANARLITVRQLLRHQSGLPNPDDTAATAESVPAYYAPGFSGSRDPLTGYCAGPVKAAPGGNWAYNNCDYIVAGALLGAVTGKSWQTLVQERIVKPLHLRSLAAFPTTEVLVPGEIDGKPETGYDIAAFGASAGLYGSVGDLWRFDRALMTGKLLPDTARAQLWDGQPRLGSIALGQWAFSARLKGCAGPVRIIERRGAIGGIEVRNFILPDNDVVAIMFVKSAGFDFGEVWQGKGVSFDLLSAAACT
ncbi:MAG: serine hydrolase domain-containing protein [Sphingomonas sp.]